MQFSLKEKKQKKNDVAPFKGHGTLINFNINYKNYLNTFYAINKLFKIYVTYKNYVMQCIKEK